MALTRTTTAAAVSLTDKQLYLASITGLQVGQTLKVDEEKMRVTQVPTSASLPVLVFRGTEGTGVAAHPITAGVAFGDGSDFAQNADPARRRRLKSYSATGALDLPDQGSDLVAELNGTVVCAMTLANPGKGSDGDILYVIGNGKAAHTVTINTAGLGNAGSGYDVLTFAAGAQNGIALIAANEIWVPLQSLWGGTATAVTVTGA